MSERFRFLGEPLFLVSGLSYTVNRWLVKPAAGSDFLRYWFSDLLLAPCALPVVFWIFRRLNLRPGCAPPSFREIFWILAVWSILFEFLGPKFVPRATGDWRDVLMYWAGGIAAWCIWNARSMRPGASRA